MTAGNLEARAAQYCEAMRVRGHVAETVEHKAFALKRFSMWCAERDIVNVTEVTRPLVERYQRWLFDFRRGNDKPLTVPTQYNHLCVLRLFFRWLVKQGLLLHNPAADLDFPRMPQRLPRHILSVEEVETLLQEPDITLPHGLRDRVILEVLYSTGMRRAEVVRLDIHDVDFHRGTVMIRQGKGRKDRVVPIGERALTWLRKYLDEVRPVFLRGAERTALFLSDSGQPLSKRGLSNAVTAYMKAAGLENKGSCHVLRHTAATLMLERGADIRFIQVMLGHADLSTTQVYTKVSIGKLKEVHDATHPGATLTTRDVADKKAT
jgi:integrase/recombinase XerD